MADKPKISGSIHKSLAESANDDINEARTRLTRLLESIKDASIKHGKPVRWDIKHTSEIGIIIGLLSDAGVKQSEQLKIIYSEFRKRGGDNILEWKDASNE